MISRKTIDEIFNVAQIEDVVDDYVNLKRRGVNMIGLCPFHNEKTPSFTVSPAKNLYKCFGCGKGGNPVNFIMEHESFTYPEALRYLAQKYNIKVEEDKQTDEAIEAQKKRESLLLVNEMAFKFFSEQLQTDEGKSIGLSYFKHRGLNERTIELFGLGYSPRGARSFTDYAIQQGYKEDLLKELGLTSNQGRDFYRERVIFPFYNLSGKIIGFGGRILKDNVKAPKYLNSPESEIYNKRKSLYGLYQARSDIRKKDSCILVEGYTDVLSLHQNEIKNVVASSGTSLTVEQVSLIKRFTQNAIVLYDGDAAGQKAALRGLDIFLEQGLNVKVVVLPEGQDPDSYVKELGSSEFEAYIKENGADFILRRARLIHKDYKNDPIQKSLEINELVKSIALIRDQIKRSLYIKECTSILNIDESSLVTAINKHIKSDLWKRQNKSQRESAQPRVEQKYVDYDPEKDHSQRVSVKVDPVNYQEKDIARILIHDGNQWYDEDQEISVADYILSNLGSVVEYLSDPLYKKILEDCINQKSQGYSPNRSYWSGHTDDSIRDFAIEVLSEKYVYAKWSEKGLELQTQKPVEENFVNDSYQAIMRFKLKKIKDKINELNKLIENEDDDSRDLIFITAYQKLLQERKAITDELKTTVL